MMKLGVVVGMSMMALGLVACSAAPPGDGGDDTGEVTQAAGFGDSFKPGFFQLQPAVPGHPLRRSGGGRNNWAAYQCGWLNKAAFDAANQNLVNRTSSEIEGETTGRPQWNPANRCPCDRVAAAGDHRKATLMLRAVMGDESAISDAPAAVKSAVNDLRNLLKRRVIRFPKAWKVKSYTVPLCGARARRYMIECVNDSSCSASWNTAQAVNDAMNAWGVPDEFLFRKISNCATDYDPSRDEAEQGCNTYHIEVDPMIAKTTAQLGSSATATAASVFSDAWDWSTTYPGSSCFLSSTREQTADHCVTGNPCSDGSLPADVEVVGRVVEYDYGQKICEGL